ncbi:hypothetical protein IEQ34_003426 [Dendrobium chrysotoxum]|uniref:Uncharacterized protein n=1 Tax=Dendrobium chrysotoxum TaxID=161865 RepID=A0AAV7HLN0_DENCH|nr:hypothetical protein IEQ34_003426 [Dendrobium chrysotoxum]
MCEIARHLVDVEGEFAGKVVFGDVELLQLGTVIENDGEFAGDVIVGEIEKGETFEITDGCRDRKRDVTIVKVNALDEAIVGARYSVEFAVVAGEIP